MPIGEMSTAHLDTQAIELYKNLRYFVAENPKTLRSFLAKAIDRARLQETEIWQLPEPEAHMEWHDLWEDLGEVKAVGVVSDAGNPCIADPGHLFVRQAIDRSAEIIPLAGPSSILLALMASGFSGQDFHFWGYLPRDNHGLRGALRRMEQELQRHGTTQVFMETPYRNQKLLESLCQILSGSTMLSVASALQTSEQQIRTMKIVSWKKLPSDILAKHPSIYCLGK